MQKENTFSGHIFVMNDIDDLLFWKQTPERLSGISD